MDSPVDEMEGSREAYVRHSPNRVVLEICHASGSPDMKETP